MRLRGTYTIRTFLKRDRGLSIVLAEFRTRKPTFIEKMHKNRVRTQLVRTLAKPPQDFFERITHFH